MDNPWSRLLPAHRTNGDDRPVGEPRLVQTVPLAESLRLSIYEDERGRSYPVPLVDSTGQVRRARSGEGAAEALVALLGGGSRRLGSVEITSWHASPATGERAITVDQTNESVVVGERAVVKWTVLADEGPHPAPSLLAELTRQRFAGMPRPWGALQWQPPDGRPARLVALVTEFVTGAVDGWSWVVDDLRQAAERNDEDVAQAAGTAVGELVAHFHLALAGTARRATAREAAALRESAVSDLMRALSVTSGAPHELLAAHTGPVRAAFEELPHDTTPVMRVHGDLHIGQVLRTGSTYVLTDFDGNPVVPAGSRALHQPAAADVAGMAQSFTHAGLVVRKHHPEVDAGVVGRMAGTARTAFLDTYRGVLGDQSCLLDQRLLRPLSLRQVCREFTYAATHLPRWSYVPEATLPMLLEEPT